MKKTTYPFYYAGKKQSFASSVVVSDLAIGKLVFCSGWSGRLAETGEVRVDDPVVQTVDALDKVKLCLEKAGTSLENIVKLTIYVKDSPKNQKVVSDAKNDYFRKHAPSLAENMPASTWIGVDSLAFPSMLVELDVIAIIPEGIDPVSKG